MVTAYHGSSLLSSIVIYSLREEGDHRFFWALTNSVITAYHVSSVLASIMISSLRVEKDGCFVGLFYLAL